MRRCTPPNFPQSPQLPFTYRYIYRKPYDLIMKAMTSADA